MRRREQIHQKYDPVADVWTFTAPEKLDDHAVESAVMNAKAIMVGRTYDLPPGDRRDNVRRAIAALDAGKIRFRLVPHEGETEAYPFKQTVGTGKIISLGT